MMYQSMQCIIEMEQNLPLEESLAPEVTAALIELAQLAQHTGSSTCKRLDTVADKMLASILVLCKAQRGAIIVGEDEYFSPMLPSFYHKNFRTLALYAIDEAEAHAFLTTFPTGDTSVKPDPDLACWLTYRRSIGTFIVEERQYARDMRNLLKITQSHSNGALSSLARQPLQVLLVLGWTHDNASECASAVARGHHVLPYVIDAIGAVIVGILQVERIHELEAVRIREPLREMELLKAELLGTVSHELRSPLASIKGYAATLIRHERRISREERQQFLLAIHSASERLEIIIQQLLEVSQLETEEVAMDRAPVDMMRLSKEAIASIEERVSEQQPDRFLFKLSLEQEGGTPASNVPLIWADQRHLRKVMGNLLENAVKYSPGGGVIKVILHRVTQFQTTLTGASFSDESAAGNLQLIHNSTRMLEILVRDSGMGIPNEHLERIFDRFHRVDTRLIREVNGLGLGLTICKRIVELHNGSIWAENRPNGKGSDFHVRLPIDEIPDM
jgi:signal transduction histidine kinase